MLDGPLMLQVNLPLCACNAQSNKFVTGVKSRLQVNKKLTKVMTQKIGNKIDLHLLVIVNKSGY